MQTSQTGGQQYSDTTPPPLVFPVRAYPIRKDLLVRIKWIYYRRILCTRFEDNNYLKFIQIMIITTYIKIPGLGLVNRVIKAYLRFVVF